jgi:hypothetical protein
MVTSTGTHNKTLFDTTNSCVQNKVRTKSEYAHEGEQRQNVTFLLCSLLPPLGHATTTQKTQRESSHI